MSEEMKTYIVMAKFKKRGMHIFQLFSPSSDHLAKAQAHESSQLPVFEIGCSRIQDFPPTLIELEKGTIINVEKYQGTDWLRKKMLQNQ